MILVQSLKTHFPERALEWYMAAVMTSMGVYFILHPTLFTNPATAEVFRGLAALSLSIGDFPPASVWGLSTLLVGLFRLGALFVNGAYSRTPIIRMACSMLSGLLWGQILLGLARSGVANLGVAIYPWFVFAEIVSAYRASSDAAIVEKNARLRRGTTGRVSHSSSLD